MSTFSKIISIRWADLDPNFHLRHSVYYDLGSQFRVELLDEAGLTMKVMKEQGFGPILFREECVFKKEILMADEITLTAKIVKMKADGSRWTIMHEFLKSEGTLCAQLTLDGAWMDVLNRRIANPTPKIAFEVLNQFPKAHDFELL
ncbi:MAG: acyl-CoA thioesterase [Bacteroidota bacterium]